MGNVRKVLWLIVYLMAMVVGFTSCSSNNKNENSTENYSYLNGEWVDAEISNVTFIIHDGWMGVVDTTSSRVTVQFEIENNIIIFKEQRHYNGKIYETPTFGKIYKMTATEFEFYMFENTSGHRFNLKRK